KYRLGLDIGITSIGYAVMETDDNGEPVAIEDLGVRIFEKPENPKDGSTLASARRAARGVRRVIRRRAHRRERTESLLISQFGAEILDRIHENTEDVFYLRYKGIEEILSDEELGRVLLYFAKHRGFLSNRKSEKNDKEGGKLLQATSKNSEYFKEKGYRTIGEMLYKDEKYFHFENGKKIYTVRNKESSYDNTFLRDELKAEIIAILDKQDENGRLGKEFIEKYLYIFYTNRNFDEGPGEPSKYRGGYAIGKCPFEEGELRAPKAAYIFEYSTALQKLNNLRIKFLGGERGLTEEERKKIIDLIKTKQEIKFGALRKVLAVSGDETFNLLNYSRDKSVEEVEKARFVSMSESYKIRKALSEENKGDIELLDEIALILSTLKSDDRRTAELDKIAVLSEAEKSALLEINVSKFGGTSLKFLKNITPYLEKGCKYNEACEKAGYNHTLQRYSGNRSKLLNTKEVHELVDEIAVPVVRRSVSQTIKVVNAVINKYGSPMAVNIELARELSKTFEERNKIIKDNEKRARDNEGVKALLQSEYHLTMPTGQDMIKYFLYDEQGGKCAYSLEPLDARRLFEPDYVQVDHIIPYSKSFDDSMNNKVLVLTKENQDKRNRLPYEYFGSDGERWKKFEDFVAAQYKGNRKKQERLLKKEFGEEDAKAWKERNLNDTKYITTFVYNLLKDNLEFDADGKSKKKVTAVNGAITSYMRKLYGLVKDRGESDKHHALDAAIIACVTDGSIQNITKYNQDKENYVFDGSNLVDKRTGEIRVKEPYIGFAKELRYRLAEHPEYYTDFFVKFGYGDKKLDGLKEVFVSRMVNKKAKGQIHDATVSSAKIYGETGKVITKTVLGKIKLKNDKNGEYYVEGCGDYYIENYYRPQDDRLLYEKLLKMLIAAGGDAKQAFKDSVYKPKADGTDGAQVRKVKILSKATSGVQFDNVKGFSENGSMVRLDVFYKNGKYYSVPVYLKDIYAKKLPDKAVVAGKEYKDWITVDDSFEFLFSLYKNDLIYVKHKDVIKLTKTNSENKDDTKEIEEGYLYYIKFGISTGSATCITPDNGYKISSLGLLTLEKLQKCCVDVLGNRSSVKKEVRQGV
ncbi:MAG: type II CRISPR RNA-guided endonuclease Cas9, partial [Clostridia bacterium]|nr:type II CRISPR RNA-guided endonuclease Cas9 [Clostridia bacterium]